MKKTFRTILLAALLCFGVLSTGVLAGQAGAPLYYFDQNGEKQNKSDRALTGIGADKESFELKEIDETAHGWYYIAAGETSSVALTVNGTTHLLLKSGEDTHNLTSITGTENGTDALSIYLGHATEEMTDSATCKIGGISNVSVTLYGGTFTSLPESGWKLGNGFCFRMGTDEEGYAYVKDFSEGATVVPCPHETVGSDNTCSVCQTGCTVYGIKFLGSDSVNRYYTSVTAAMDFGCNTVKLLGDCDETVELASLDTVDLNGHTLTALSVPKGTATEFSLTIEDNSEAKTGIITTLTVNSNTTLKGGNFGTINILKDTDKIPDPAKGYAYQSTAEGGAMIKLSELGTELTNVKVVACTSHSYTDDTCEYCGDVCEHTNVNESGECSDCHYQYAVKRELNAVTAWYDNISTALNNVGSTTSGNPIVSLTLYQDVNAGCVSIDKLNLTLDLNGHTLTANIAIKSGMVLLKNGDKQTGGTLTGTVTNEGTGGMFSTGGDVTISGHVKLARLDTFGVGTKLQNGVETVATGRQLVNHLDSGTAFATTYDSIIDGAVTSIDGAVKVIRHETHSFEDGKCACGYVCEHTNVNESGYCPNCKRQFLVKAVKGGGVGWGNTVSEAKENIKNTGGLPSTGGEGDSYSFTLYGDLTEKSVFLVTGHIELDLNGYTYNSSQTIAVGNPSGARGYLVIKDSSAAKTGQVKCSVGTDDEYSTLILEGGTFASVTAQKGSTPAKLLGKGYAYQSTAEDGGMIKLSTLTDRPLTNVKVVPCTSHSYADGICDFCGAELVAKVTNGETETYYDSFSKALDNTGAEQTLTLLRDVELTSTVSTRGKQVITLDLNGKTISDKSGNGSIQIGSGTTVTLIDNAETLGKITAPIALREDSPAEAGNLIVNSAVTLGTVNVYDGTLTVNANATFTLLSMEGGTAELKSGIYVKVSAGTGVKVNTLLVDGYIFKEQSEQNITIHDDTCTHTGELTDVRVEQVPIRDMSIKKPDGELVYGKTTTFEVNATSELVTVEYSWKLNDSPISGDGKTVTTNGFKVGENTISCTITEKPVEQTYCNCGGGVYSRTVSMTFNVTKATLIKSENYTEPTARELTYNAQKQVLVSPPSKDLPSGTTVYYIERSNWNSDISEITATNAGTYTVYWYIDGGENYNNVGSVEQPAGSVTVTIEPNDIGNYMQSSCVYYTTSDPTYNGQPQTPTYELKLKSRNMGSEIVEYETLREGTDYTVTVTPQTDAGWHSITFTGKGNYTGTATQGWCIEKATYTNQAANGAAKFGAAGTVDLSALVMAGGQVAVTSVDKEVLFDTYSVDNDTKLLHFVVKNDETLVGQTATAVIAVTDCTNYKNYQITVTLRVTDKYVPVVTPPAAIADLTYNGTAQTLITAATATGGILKYSLDGVNWSETLPAAKNAGTYTVYYKVEETADYAGVAANTLTVTVGKATATIVADDKTVTVGAAMPELTYTVRGLAGGDTLTAQPTLTCTATDTDTVGTYPITVSGGDAGENYTLSYQAGTLTVAAKSTSSNITTVTKPNEDGSVTTTVTNRFTGTTTETTRREDGSSTVVETRKDGSATTTETAANGVTSTTVTDEDGKVTSVSANIPASAAADGERVTLPVDEVNLESGTVISVTVPAGGATVEVPVENPTAGTVIVIVSEDGTETVLPASKVTEGGVAVTLTENATIKVIDNSKEFDDVPETEFYADAVAWASARGITNGMTETEFGVGEDCNRAHIITFLWRAASCPAAEGDVSFSDVPDDEFYSEAVKWAASAGITNGYGDDSFGVGDTVTREQVAVMIYRYAQSQGKGFTGAWAFRLDFEDVAELSDWAVEGISWCVMNGIMQGYEGRLTPQEPCNRAQIMTMLYRMTEKL